ncbi:MAG TPA: hypothetical protein VIE66_09430 [Methylocella sp.]
MGSVIAPSTVPAAILGLILAVAGNGTWLSFLLGMIELVLVSFNIKQFARRSASPGSLYTYIVRGLGPTAGVRSGWAPLFRYMLTGMTLSRSLYRPAARVFVLTIQSAPWLDRAAYPTSWL